MCIYCYIMDEPSSTGSALVVADATARIDRCKFVKNTILEAATSFSLNPLGGGGAIVYNGLLKTFVGDPLPPLVVSRSSFVKNKAFGPGGAIIAYNVPDPFAFERRVRFRRNVSQQNATLGDTAAVDLPLS